MFDKNDQPGPRRQRRIDRYQQLVEQISPKSDFGMGLLHAFWVGGTICMLGQALTEAGKAWLHLSNWLASGRLATMPGFLDGAFDGHRRV